MECIDCKKSLLSVLLFFFIFFSCGHKKDQYIPGDFTEILNKGEITALTLSGSFSYFVYKGETKGYEYEYLKTFTDSLQLRLHIKLAENETKLTEMLMNGEGDLIACNIPLTNDGKKNLLYCGQEIINEMALIQRSGKGNTILKEETELIGKEVWVIHDSKYYQRLIHLNNETGGGIHICTIDKDTVSVEDLIGMVSDGTISYTISDVDIAKLNKSYYRNIDVNLIIAHSQRSSWAVRKTTPELASAINQWFENNEKQSGYQGIIKRYFEMSKMPGDEPAPLLRNGQISLYDDLFKKYAPEIGWDWRLLASIAFQESKFYTNRTSWAGAAGLMGLMPKTAGMFGLSQNAIFNPGENLKAAVKLIGRLNRSFSSIEDPDERMKFIIAAYNSGSGHIYDAQALAEKYGENPTKWTDVEKFLKLKNDPEYYNDPVCKSGYFRSKQTVLYLHSVMERWAYYKEKVVLTPSRSRKLRQSKLKTKN
jgi:membrane-bound lytic murein transglycosylase F